MNERSLFLAALEIPDPAQRAAYLEKACAGDPAVRCEVEGLLAAHARSGSFMPAPAGGQTTGDDGPGEGPGSRVGPYKLLQQIGEGGMGVVYMAEQEQPVRRMVALKIIREGMDSKAVLARFEAERQALALMDHPNIARVLDAGTTESGRPFFVMELVKGTPITKFCDENQLPLRERLELFVPVCQAIQHAHQKGIIHRDIKPSNVLVALYDDKPVPKVIDFGVAKATSQKLTDKTMFTAFGSVVGTLEYMSPEQAKLNQLDIDTRSDVYALGVLLYELLTGTTPLDRARLKSAALDEVLRLIREEEPERPSTRLSTAQTRPAIAAARRIEPAQLGKSMRGELDWIVMKALEKDRTRRYETANGLARDVERYLKDEAVEACPPTLGYRLRKLYRKNRPAAGVAAAFLVLLTVGAAVCVWQAVRATKAERDALAQSRVAEEKEAAAVREADKARALVGMVQELLGTADPDAAKGGDYTVRQMLDDFETGLRERLKDQPEAEADLRMTIGKAYLSMRLLEANKAEEQFRLALDLRRRVFGPDHRKVAQTRSYLAWALQRLGGKLAESEEHARAAIDILRRLDDRGEDMANALRILAYPVVRKNADEAEALFRKALEIAEGLAGGRPTPLAADISHDLATLLWTQARGAEGVTFATQSVKLHAIVHSDKHPQTARGLVVLGDCHLVIGQWADAEREYGKALTIYRRASGSQPSRAALTTLGSLLAVLDLQFKEEAADARLRECLAGWKKSDLSFPGADGISDRRAAAALSRGDHAAAERHYRQTLEARQKAPASLEWPSLIWMQFCVGATLFSQGKADEARAVLQGLVSPARRAVQKDDLDQYDLMAFAGALSVAGSGQAEDLQAALALARRAVEKSERGPPQMQILALHVLAGIHQRRGELDQAIEVGRKALTLVRPTSLSRVAGGLYWRTALEERLVECLIEKGDRAAAEEVMRDGLKLFQAHLPKGDPALAAAQVNLAAFLTDQKCYAEAEPLLVAAHECLKAHPQAATSASLKRRQTEVLEQLIRLADAAGKPEEAKKWQAERAKFDPPALKPQEKK